MGGGFGEIGQVRDSWYYLTGGALGAAYVTTVLVTVRELGAGGVTAATIAGQLTMSVVLDRAGVLGLPEKAVTCRAWSACCCWPPASSSSCATEKAGSVRRGGRRIAPRESRYRGRPDHGIRTARPRPARRARRASRRSAASTCAARRTTATCSAAVVSLLFAVCGGLAAIFLFFAAMGAVDLGDAVAATVIAVVWALVWFAGFYYRHRTDAGAAQWRDRERRGF